MMKIEDVLRKIQLLRRFVPENGAFHAEAETAAHLVWTLMERYSIGIEQVRAVANPARRMSWVYCEQAVR